MERTAIVTGAGRGIGAACLHALRDAGWGAIGLDREVPDDAVDVWRCDVTDADAVAEAAERVAERGGCAALVNVAGILRNGTVADIDATAVREMVDVNVLGVLHCLQAFHAQLVEHRGSVVTVASNSAGVPRTGIGAYGATKAAATMLTRSFGLENAQAGIRANVVQPGSTRTPMLTGLWTGEGDEEATLNGDPAAYRLGIPLGRIADPADIADTVRFLVGDGARHITLQELYVDGGASLHG